MQAVTPTDIQVITDTQVIPAFTTYTGTFTTSGVVVTGVGSKFLLEYLNGFTDAYLYSSAKAQYRKILGVTSDLILIIESAFATDVSVAESVKIVRPKFSSVTLNVTGGGSATRYTSYAGQDTLNASQAYEFSADPFNKLEPMVVNGTGTTVEVIIHV